MYYQLTKKQGLILDFIKAEIKTKGYAPSVREICESVGLKSTSTVHSHLKTLEKLEFIKRDPTRPRAMSVLSKDNDLTFNNFDPSLINLNKINALPVLETLSQINFSVYINRGDSMANAGIFDNDAVIVDSNVCNLDGKVVLAIVNNEYCTIKRYSYEGNSVKLSSDDGSGDFIMVDYKNVKVAGIVVGSFRGVN